MRSEFRCGEHYQGDKCLKVDGHVDAVHIGRHNTWTVTSEGPSKILEVNFEEAVEVLAGV